MIKKLIEMFSKNKEQELQPSRDYLKNFKPKYHHLAKGNSYIICNQFQDYDFKIHKVGTVIEFFGYDFFPYDAGLTLLFFQGTSEYVIRLRVDQRDSQSEVNENLEKYIAINN